MEQKLIRLLVSGSLAWMLLLSAPASVGEEGMETGTDPRDFAPKFMPYYRFTELENGLENDALTLFGLHAFSKKFALTYQCNTNLFAITALIA